MSPSLHSRGLEEPGCPLPSAVRRWEKGPSSLCSFSVWTASVDCFGDATLTIQAAINAGTNRTNNCTQAEVTVGGQGLTLHTIFTCSTATTTTTTNTTRADAEAEQ